jgi:hypothetical protein
MAARITYVELEVHKDGINVASAAAVCVASGELQRRHKLPSDLLVYDLRYRLRCPVCPRKERARCRPASPHRRGEVPERVRL